MAKPSLWQRIKAKFNRKKHGLPIKEIQVKSKETLREIRIQAAKQLWKARVAIRRLRFRDKRKVPIFLLTFDEIEQMLKDTPLILPSRIDEEKSD
jgi:hypothetical protein